ncbi:hypothetical protein niasHT_011192 [Heterodera trifolii]|uniref:Uncharacterized protein n=1 Tax=Heterodera trifolii TaxID=157864 RepID=A0ABD2LD50_9BILA
MATIFPSSPETLVPIRNALIARRQIKLVSLDWWCWIQPTTTDKRQAFNGLMPAQSSRIITISGVDNFFDYTI